MALAFRSRLAAGAVALGCNVRFSRSAEIGPMLADCGYHWLMLDDEHSPASPHFAYDIALAAIRAGVLPIARTSSHDPAAIARLLTNGALGVLAPHVDTPEQAAAVAQAARFAPLGALAVPGTMPHFGYALSLMEACARFNDEVIVVAMIESRLGRPTRRRSQRPRVSMAFSSARAICCGILASRVRMRQRRLPMP